MTAARMREIAEQALGRPVARLAADTLGGSNAVYFLDLRDGDRCVLRVSPPGQADLVTQEAWALSAARAVGVPTPEVLVADTTLRYLDRPYLIMRRLPGVAAFRAPLSRAARADLLAQLGAILARLHRLPLAGFGPLRGGDGTYRGGAPSWWEYVHAEGQRRLARLAGTALPPYLARRIAGHLDRALAWSPPGPAVLVHGDFQLKNVLVHAGRVSGIVDFENLLAGDPLLDFAPLRYWSRDPACAMAALGRGYGRAPLADPGAGGRLALYELLLALEIRWWEVHLGVPTARRGAHAQLERALATLDARSGWRAPFPVHRRRGFAPVSGTTIRPSTATPIATTPRRIPWSYTQPDHGSTAMVESSASARTDRRSAAAPPSSARRDATAYAWDQLTPVGRLRRMRRLAAAALAHYDLSGARLAFLRAGDTLLYRATTPSGDRFLLRLQEPSRRAADALAGELTWLTALRREGGLTVPEPIPTSDGTPFAAVSADGVPGVRRAVLLRWVAGQGRSANLTPADAHRLGACLARLHRFARRWSPPPGFVRPRWDPERWLGRTSPLWSRGARAYPSDELAVFAAAARRIRRDLRALGASPATFGLIHADLAPSNVVFRGGEAHAIDFEECGWGYYLFDLAVSLVALEDYGPRGAALQQALLAGYRTLGALPEGYATCGAAFVALIRIKIVAWVLSGEGAAPRPPAYLAQAFVRLGHFVNEQGWD